MRVRSRTIAMLALVVMLSCIAHSSAQDSALQTATLHDCSKPLVFGDRRLSTLPYPMQSKIRAAIKSEVQAILQDPSMGLQKRSIPSTAFSIVPLTPAIANNRLLAVSWRDSTFGSDGPIWIVSLNADAATNLTPGHGSLQRWGFGVKVLSNEAEAYPRILIAGKARLEATSTCLEKTVTGYKPIACSPNCDNQLNTP